MEARQLGSEDRLGDPVSGGVDGGAGHKAIGGARQVPYRIEDLLHPSARRRRRPRGRRTSRRRRGRGMRRRKTRKKMKMHKERKKRKT